MEPSDPQQLRICNDCDFPASVSIQCSASSSFQERISMFYKPHKLLKSAFLLLAVIIMLSTEFPAAPTVEIVMRGLDNPRGLALGPEGGLYVVEAGRGGTGPCQTLRGALQCYGASGAVTRLWGGNQERVITGLPSQVDPTGQAVGPHDISFQGRGGAYISVGFGGDPSLRSNFGADGALFGTLVHAPASGKWRVIGDISGYETSAILPEARLIPIH